MEKCDWKPGVLLMARNHRILQWRKTTPLGKYSGSLAKWKKKNWNYQKVAYNKIGKRSRSHMFWRLMACHECFHVFYAWSHWKAKVILYPFILLLSLHRLHYAVCLYFYDFGYGLVKEREWAGVPNLSYNWNLGQEDLPLQDTGRKHWGSHAIVKASGRIDLIQPKECQAPWADQSFLDSSGYIAVDFIYRTLASQKKSVRLH